MTDLVRHWKRDGADVYIGRPSIWGNPFEMREEAGRESVVERFRRWLDTCSDLKRMVRRELVGKTLGCWCAPRLCHGHVLAEVANDATVSGMEPVFVFGSNLAGRHGKGAARFAAQYRGAMTGVAEGSSGGSYAIPTKDAQLSTLDYKRVAEGVEKFVAMASANPGVEFDVSAIGCGLAGYRDQEIAPLFERAPANCRLPYRWRRLLDSRLPPRVIVAGSRGFSDDNLLFRKLEHLLCNEPDAGILSGGAKGADQLGEKYAVGTGRSMIRVPADWKRYGKAAGMIRNQHMSFLASHVVAFWDGRSPGTRNMISTAQADGLQVRVVEVH